MNHDFDFQSANNSNYPNRIEKLSKVTFVKLSEKD